MQGLEWCMQRPVMCCIGSSRIPLSPITSYVPRPASGPQLCCGGYVHCCTAIAKLTACTRFAHACITLHNSTQVTCVLMVLCTVIFKGGWLLVLVLPTAATTFILIHSLLKSGLATGKAHGTTIC